MEIRSKTESQDGIWDYFQNEGLESFDGSGGRLGYIIKHIERGERILNIGIGSGYLEETALRKHIDVYSLDPSKRAIEGIQQRFNFGDKAKVGYSQNIPFENSMFDVVVMSEVLEHLPDDTLSLTLSEVYRVLRDGGRLIGTVPARENLSQQLVVCPCCGERFHRWGHEQSFDKEKLKILLSTHFNVECLKEKFFIAWATVGLSEKVKALIKKLLSYYGIGTYGTNRNIFFTASKSRRGYD